MRSVIAFLNSDGRYSTETESGVCCHCEPNERTDNNAMVLFRRHCPAHGRCWHRLMTPGPAGVTKLAFPVKPERRE